MSFFMVGHPKEKTDNEMKFLIAVLIAKIIAVNLGKIVKRN